LTLRHADIIIAIIDYAIIDYYSMPHYSLLPPLFHAATLR